MSVKDKFDSVRGLLGEHNKTLESLKQSHETASLGIIDIDNFFLQLTLLGATTEDRLKSLSYEDILSCFTTSVKPILLAKDIAKKFRGKEEVPAEEKRPISSVRVDRMTNQELVAAFDPEESHNAVGKKLAELAKGQPFIVYVSGRTVDVESTLKLLLEIKSGYVGRNDYTVNGVTKKVYRLGELPDAYADENPLYVGRPLRPDGTCDQTGRSWEGVPLTVRQLVRVGIDCKEINVSIEIAHYLLDLALQPDAMLKLRERYRKASVEFDRLEGLGNLPRLKIALGGTASPFGQGAKVVWQTAPNNNSYRATELIAEEYKANIVKQGLRQNWKFNK